MIWSLTAGPWQGAVVGVLDIVRWPPHRSIWCSMPSPFLTPQPIDEDRVGIEPGCGAGPSARITEGTGSPPLFAQRSEARAHLFHQELRLFPRREVPALVELVVM